MDTKNKTIIVLIGIPGSGKSSYINNIKELENYTIICGDDIRLALNTIFDIRIEPVVHCVSEIMTRACMVRNRNVIIDETNTKLDSIIKWTSIADEFSYNKVAFFFTTPTNICINRNNKRNQDKVPDCAMERMITNFEKLKNQNLLEYFDRVHFINTNEQNKN